MKRQSVSSKARLSYMSPASQLKRRQSAQYIRKLSAQKLARYKENEVMLNDLEKLFKEGNEHGVGELMKEIWFTDKKRQT